MELLSLFLIQAILNLGSLFEHRLFQKDDKVVVVDFPSDRFDVLKYVMTPQRSQETLLGSYQVTYIIDGDTFKVSKDGTQENVRLIGVDTPETVDPDEPVGCFGIEARGRSIELLSGEEVRLEQDPTQNTRDKYGRILAYAFLSDGTNVNKALIEGGYGYEYTYITAYKYQSEFKEAEHEARENKRGLWADGVCENFIPPSALPLKDTSLFTCFYNAYNCVSFGSRAEAQKVYEACGGLTNDVHWLDGDKDGRACEVWP